LAIGPTPLSHHRPVPAGCSRVQKEISRNFVEFRSSRDAFPLPRRKGYFKNEKASPKVQETFGRLSSGTFWRPRFMTAHSRKLLTGFSLYWMDGNFSQNLD
jgi:hypothetical protein